MKDLDNLVRGLGPYNSSKAELHRWAYDTLLNQLPLHCSPINAETRGPKIWESVENIAFESSRNTSALAHQIEDYIFSTVVSLLQEDILIGSVFADFFMPKLHNGSGNPKILLEFANKAKKTREVIKGMGHLNPFMYFIFEELIYTSPRECYDPDSYLKKIHVATSLQEGPLFEFVEAKYRDGSYSPDFLLNFVDLLTFISPTLGEKAYSEILCQLKQGNEEEAVKLARDFCFESLEDANWLK